MSSISDGIKPKSIMPYYEEIMSAKYIGIPMYIYIPKQLLANILKLFLSLSLENIKTVKLIIAIFIIFETAI